ncbi:MAG: hypothetical protein V3V49_12235 [Candidatus Krumholzibacteria bacterium]
MFVKVRHTGRVWIGLVLVGAAGVLLGCGRQEHQQRAAVHASVRYVEKGDSFPLIEYADGQRSLNDRCPVRQTKLNLKMPPVYVNGRPVGFC